MATNLHALIRYTVIDRCLRDHDHVYQWNDLAEACAEAFASQGREYKIPAKRTIMQDIRNMRSGTLGYEAPIEHSKERGYYYSMDRFSIHHQPLHKRAIEDLIQGVHIIKQLTGSLRLTPIEESMKILASAYNADFQEMHPLVYIEESYNSKGHKWLEELYNHIRSQLCLTITYTSFDGVVTHHTFHPYFLKEYNSRWYIYGHDDTLDKIINLSLDRITSIVKSLKPYEEKGRDVFFNKFEHVYGVTLPSDGTPIRICFSCSDTLSPYMRSKPIHRSQRETAEDVYEITTYLNYEIIHKLLSFGKDLVVLSPISVVDEMRNEVIKMNNNYKE